MISLRTYAEDAYYLKHAVSAFLQDRHPCGWGFWARCIHFFRGIGKYL